MEVFEIILIISAILVFWDITLLRKFKRGRKFEEKIPGIILANLALIISYVWLAYGYVSNNVKIEEVYYYSSSGLNFIGRLYASWASSGSSWLFLSALFAGGYLIFRLIFKDDRIKPKVFEVMDLLLLFFILVVLIQNPFKTLPFTPPDGKGLNPLLQTPWMLIHPPIVFIGYVLALYGFAFSFESFKGYGRRKKNRPDPESWRFIKGINALGWLFLTLGIAIGGLWAYEVLGWGGYWAWDPVETASLIPWITLTAFFHLTRNQTGDSTTQQFMLMVTSALIVFATALTRGGLAVSVHAFGTSPIGYILLLLMVVLILYFVNEQGKTGVSLFGFNMDTESVYNSSISLGFVSLVMISLVCFWGLAFPIFNSAVTGSEVSMDVEFFNRWTYPFALLFMASLTGCHLHDKLNMKTYSGLVGVLIVLGIIGAFMGLPTSNMLVNLGIPLTFAALGAIIYGIVAPFIKGRISWHIISRRLLHLGIVLVMLGILLGSPAKIDYGEFVVKPNSYLDLGPMRVEFEEFEIVEPFGDVYDLKNLDFVTNPEAVGFKIPVTVTDGGSRLTGVVDIYLYTIYGLVSRPLVLRNLRNDVYIVLQQTQSIYSAMDHTLRGIPIAPSEFAVSVLVFPLMNLIWVGSLLMSLGIIIPIVNAFKLRKTEHDS
jgi:cytochrome c-type biogenesis protein CcmF